MNSRSSQSARSAAHPRGQRVATTLMLQLIVVSIFASVSSSALPLHDGRNSKGHRETKQYPLPPAYTPKSQAPALAVPVAGVNDANLTGSWTGFLDWDGGKPLYDWYEIVSFPDGSFTVQCGAGYSCGWVNGSGVVSGDTVTVTLSVSKADNHGRTSVALTGTLQFDSSTGCGWTDVGQGGPLPPPQTASCTVITWDTNKSSWVLLQPIDTVHAIFMNHLDVGYNGIPLTGFINNILNIYFHEYFPRALSVARTLKALGRPEQLIYTTHPWLVALYLNCPDDLVLAGIPLQCPTVDEIEEMQQAIRHGYITWHRGPFNLQPENMDWTLFEYALSIAADLDVQFGFAPKMTLSQRDVPGMTRAVVPILAKNNVSALSVGVNDGTCSPHVPRAFIWRDEASASQVLAMFHAGGYPDNPGDSAQNAGGLSRRDCVIIRGFRQALCWVFRTDNSGPPMDISEVFSNFAVLRTQFPGSKIMASTFDAFASEVLANAVSLLPVVTEEIGDVWIQGIASDPFKMQTFRAINRVRADCLNKKQCKADDPVLKEMAFYLIKPPEHTWGLPSVGDGQTSAWSNAQFQLLRNGSEYRDCAAAWQEQRVFNDLAVQTLVSVGHPLATKVESALAELKPQEPDLSGYTQQSDLSMDLVCGSITLAFDGVTGGIAKLIDSDSGKSWADHDSLLAQLQYVTWSESGYNTTAHVCDQVLGGKPNSDEANPADKTWFASMEALYINNSNPCSYLVQLSMPADTVENYGGFAQGWVNVDVSLNPTAVSVQLQWFNKTATRLAESFWMSFTPPVQEGFRWYMNKLGSWVDPLDVINGGSQRQHAVWDGVLYVDMEGSQDQVSAPAQLLISSVDVPLVSPVTTESPPTPLTDTVDYLPGQIQGFAFNLYNNVWNTNYIFWYPFMDGDNDAKFRFRILVSN